MAAAGRRRPRTTPPPWGGWGRGAAVLFQSPPSKKIFCLVGSGSWRETSPSPAHSQARNTRAWKPGRDLAELTRLLRKLNKATIRRRKFWCLGKSKTLYTILIGPLERNKGTTSVLPQSLSNWLRGLGPSASINSNNWVQILGVLVERLGNTLFEKNDPTPFTVLSQNKSFRKNVSLTMKRKK